MAFPDDRDRELQRRSIELLDLADDVVDWVGQFNPNRAQQDLAPIPPSDEFQLLTLRRQASNLFRSSRVPVAAAVYGPSQTGKSLFVDRLLLPADPEFSALGRDEKLGPPSYIQRLSFNCDLNPRCGSQEATAIVTRFTTKDRFDETALPSYPVLVRALSRSEWLRVLARGYRSECPMPDHAWQEEHVEKLFIDVNKEHGADNVDREWRMDLIDLYSYVRRLEKLRYPADEAVFNGLLNRYPLSDDGYAEIAAKLCWNGWPELTSLFHRICRFLDKLKSQRDKAPGMLAHWAAVRFILDSQLSDEHESENSEFLNKVSWQDLTDKWEDGWYCLDYEKGAGPPQEKLETIQAAMLELVIPVVPDRLTAEWRHVLDQIDFLDIPGVRAEGRSDSGGGTMTNAEKLDDQMRIVKRGKVFYLFERYIEELQIQTLLLLISGRNLEVRGLLRDYIDKWGRARFGKDAWPRQVRDDPPPLFVGMTGIDEEFDKEAPKKQLYESRLSAIVDDTLNEVMTNFGGKGRPFTNVYPIRYPGAWDADAERRGDDAKWEKAGQCFLEAEMVRTYVANPSRKWRAAMDDRDGGASGIAAGFKDCTNPLRKQDELDKALSDVRSRLLQLTQSWVIDPDTNLDRQKRRELGEKVVLWLTSNELHVYDQVEALEGAMCLRKGEEFALADLAEDLKRKSSRKRPEHIEDVLPDHLKLFLHEWGTSVAPGRWNTHVRNADAEVDWLQPETFGSLTRYIVDYLCSPTVFDELCDRVLKIVKLKVRDENAKKEARRKYIRLLLNDYFMNPGPDPSPLEPAQDFNGHEFGLMERFVRRWVERLPCALAEGAGDNVKIPPGNDALVKLVDGGSSA